MQFQISSDLISESLRLESSEKISAKNFTLLDTEDINSGPIYRRVNSFWEVIRLFGFISINKFGKFKNPFATITSLSELGHKHRLFILVAQSKELISTKKK